MPSVGYDLHSQIASTLWRAVSLDTAIIATHTPAYNHRDSSQKLDAAGSLELRGTLWRVRSKLASCGHLREGRGVGVVDPPALSYTEHETTQCHGRGAGKKEAESV